MKNTFSVFFLLVFCSLWSQYSIRGTLTDENKKPLENAHIHIGKKIAVSTGDGFFEIKEIPAGLKKLYISYIGYQSISVELIVDKDLIYNATLFPLQMEFNEIVVKGRGLTHTNTVKETTVNGRTLENYSSKSVAEALQEVSGVSLLKTGNAIVKPVINGLHSSRVQVISNNVRLEDQQWGTEHAPNIDINAADKISLIKGASALQFGGDAIGGIIIVDVLPLKRDTIVGKTIANFASNGRGGLLSSNLKIGSGTRWNYIFNGTLKNFGDREAPHYVLSNSGNREQNFSGTVFKSNAKQTFEGFYSFYNAQIGILQASHIGNVTDLYNSINNQIPSVISPFTYAINAPRQEVQHHLAKISYKRFLAEDASLALQYAFQFNNRQEFDLRRSVNNDRAALDLELSTHTVLMDYKKKSDAWNFASGVNLGYQNNFSNPNTGIRPLIPSYEKLDVGVYGIASHQWTNATSIESGVRYDLSSMNATKFYLKSRWDERNYSNDFADFIVGEANNQWLTKPSFTFHNFSGNIGLRQKFHHELEWLFNVNMASRNPNPSELFSDGLHHSTGQIELGELRLQQEQAFKIQSTLKKDWKAVTVEMSPFLNRIKNFIYLQPVGFETTIRGAFPVWEYNQTDALLLGVDFNSTWNVNSNFRHLFQLSYVNGRNTTENDDLIDMPPLTIRNKIEFKKEEWYHFTTALKSELVFTQNNFPNFNFESSIIENNELIPVMIDVSTPPQGYHLLHFSAEMMFTLQNKNSITTSFSIENLGNTTYRDYLNRQRLFVDELGRNFQIQIKYNY